MFVYVKYVEKDTEDTVLSFRGGDEVVKVNSFDVNVVSIESEDEIKIDELIANQPSEINCVKIAKEEFCALVKDSAQLNRIRSIVKTRIAEKYDHSEEISILKKSPTNTERKEYSLWVEECLNIGTGLKESIGYFTGLSTQSLDSAIEQHMESKAIDWGYSSIDRAILYIGGSNVEWHKEGIMFREWRVAVWEYAQTQLPLIESGQRALPTKTQLLQELPSIEIFKAQQGL